MSRNLSTTCCYHCGADVVLVGPERPLEGHGTYEGMIVADAECPVCLASYLAWVGPPPNDPHDDRRGGEQGFYDLSYRHSFNDEPDERDLPRFAIERQCEQYVRVGAFDLAGSPYVDLGPMCCFCNAEVLLPGHCIGLRHDDLSCPKCDRPTEDADDEEMTIAGALVSSQVTMPNGDKVGVVLLRGGACEVEVPWDNKPTVYFWNGVRLRFVAGIPRDDAVTERVVALLSDAPFPRNRGAG